MKWNTLRPAWLIMPLAALLAIGTGPLRLKAQERRPSLTGIHAITGARILTEPGRVIENGTIVVRNGVIVAVGADAQVPQGATVLDASGLTVTAGFILGGPELAPPEADTAGGAKAGSPTALRHARGLTAERMAADLLTGSNLAGKAWLAQGVTALLTVPGGRAIAGHACLVSTADGTASERIHQNPSALRVRFRGASGYPRSIMGVVAALRQTFISSAEYLDVRDRYRTDPSGMSPPPWQPDLERMVDVIQGREPVLFDAAREGDVRRALSLAREFALKAWIRGARPLSEAAGTLAGTAATAVLTLNPGKIVYASNSKLAKGPKALAEDDDQKPGEGKLGDQEAAVKTPPDGYAALRREEKAKKEREELERFFKAGGQLSAAGVPWFFSAESASKVLEQIRAQVLWGLEKDLALQALTLRPAEQLGLERSRGRVATGMVADLVVFDGDPFEKGKVRHVFSRGIRFDIKEKKKKDKKASEALARLTGEWTIEGEGGTSTRSLTLKLEDGVMAGSMSTRFGEATVTDAELTERDFKIEISMSGEQGDRMLTITGQISEDGKALEGNIEIPGMGSIPFKAKKKDTEDRS